MIDESHNFEVVWSYLFKFMYIGSLVFRSGLNVLNVSNACHEYSLSFHFSLDPLLGLGVGKGQNLNTVRK